MPAPVSDSPGGCRGDGDAGQADARPDAGEPQPDPGPDPRPDPRRDRETPAVPTGDDGYMPL
jgi:hypothetical protein